MWYGAYSMERKQPWSDERQEDQGVIWRTMEEILPSRYCDLWSQLYYRPGHLCIISAKAFFIKRRDWSYSEDSTTNQLRTLGACLFPLKTTFLSIFLISEKCMRVGVFSGQSSVGSYNKREPRFVKAQYTWKFILWSSPFYRLKICSSSVWAPFHRVSVVKNER